MSVEIILEEGLIVMGIGMGVVISFLCILVFAMSVTSKAILALNKIFPEIAPAAPIMKKAATSDDTEIAVIIAAAKRN